MTFQSIRVEWFELAIAIVVIGTILVLGLIITDYIDATKFEKQCLEFGYVDTVVRQGEAYCIRTVDGSDQVKPLDELRDGQE